MQARRALVSVFAGLVIGLGIGSALARPDDGQTLRLDRDFRRPLKWLVTQIQERYVEEVDHRKLLVGTCQGMLSELDPYSTYWPTGMLAALQAEADGALFRPGLEVRFDALRKVVFVEQSTPGTAAFRQGLLPGDLILEVREESTGQVTKTSDFDTVLDAVNVLWGQRGTELTITVLQPEDGKKRSITKRSITFSRQSADVPGVYAVEMIDTALKIGYVHVAHLGDTTGDELERAMAELQAQAAEGLVLDLRFNPGGALQNARAVADLFLDRKPIVSIKGRTGPATTVFTRDGEACKGLPVVVLANRFSAGCAEVVSAALRDHQRATLVGEQTAGKASIQTLTESPFDDGTIRLTTARYYAPSGAAIEEHGVEPDVKVEVSHRDTRRLALYLANRTEQPTRPPEITAAEQPEPDADKEAEEEAEEEFRDVQFERAVEVLTAALSGKGPEDRPPVGEPQAAASSPG